MIGSSNAVQEPHPQQVAEPHGAVIALFGAKGGVGASTVAVNLALCAQQGRTKESVALGDLNLQAGDLHLLLGLEPAHRWRGVMRQADRLDATFLMSLLAKHPSGLHLLASDYDGLGDTVLNPELVSRALLLLRALFPIVIVDCGHVLQAPVRKALEQATTVLVVSGIEIPAMRRTKRLLEVLPPLIGDNRKIQVLINGLDRNDQGLLMEAETALGHRVAWHIPADSTEARSAIELGQPLCAISRRRDVVQAYRSLASALTMSKPSCEHAPPPAAAGWAAKLLALVTRRSLQDSGRSRESGEQP